MSTYEFDYQLVSFRESLKRVSEDFKNNSNNADIGRGI